MQINVNFTYLLSTITSTYRYISKQPCRFGSFLFGELRSNQLSADQLRLPDHGSQNDPPHRKRSAPSGGWESKWRTGDVLRCSSCGFRWRLPHLSELI